MTRGAQVVRWTRQNAFGTKAGLISERHVGAGVDAGRVMAEPPVEASHTLQESPISPTQCVSADACMSQRAGRHGRLICRCQGKPSGGGLKVRDTANDQSSRAVRQLAFDTRTRLGCGRQTGHAGLSRTSARWLSSLLPPRRLIV